MVEIGFRPLDEDDARRGLFRISAWMLGAPSGYSVFVGLPGTAPHDDDGVVAGRFQLGQSVSDIHGGLPWLIGISRRHDAAEDDEILVLVRPRLAGILGAPAVDCGLERFAIVVLYQPDHPAGL